MLEKLQQAVTAIKEGDKDTGRKLLLEILKTDPNNENALLWLSTTTNDVKKKQQCMERVLAINPNNEHAKQGLAKLQQVTLPNEENRSPIKPKPLPKPKTMTKAESVITQQLPKKKKRNPIIIFLAILGFVSLLFCLCVLLLRPRSEQPPQSVLSSVINTEFEQVGYFKSDTLRGFTFFVKNSNKQDIQTFCEQKKAQFPSGRILKIHFFDNRQYTPDVTLDYYFPESSDPYLVADCFFNPFNKEQDLKFHKNIPDQPEKRE